MAENGDKPTYYVLARHTPCPVKEADVEAATPAEALEKFYQDNLKAAAERKQSGPALVRLIEAWRAQGGLARVEVRQGGVPVEAPALDGFAAVQVGGSVAPAAPPAEAPADRRPVRRRRQTQGAVEAPPQEGDAPPEEMASITV